MSTTLQPDQYGRTVVLETDGVTDTYSISDGQGTTFTIQQPAGTPQEQVYETINSMAPGQ